MKSFVLLALLCFAPSVMALRVAATTRRAVLGGAAAAALLPRTPAAVAADEEALSEAAVLERAKSGSLNTDRVIARAKAGKLVSADSASCADLEKIIAVDRLALEQEQAKLAKLREKKVDNKDDTLKKTIKKRAAALEEIEEKIDAQVARLQAKKSECS